VVWVRGRPAVRPYTTKGKKFLEAFVLMMGLCIGSFLNVCIYRIPASLSIVSPGSTCMACGQPIRFYDNIPVISYLLLQGRCRHCKTPFSLRYPLVELLSGLFALGAFLRWGLTAEALIYYILICALVVITFIDIDHYIIPDVISLPGIPAGVIAAFLLPDMTVKASVIGLLLGGGTLFAVAWTYERITHKEGMGGGDIKLLAMIGAFLGWKGVLVTLFTGSVVGTIAGGAMMLATRSSLKLKIPFGPFLAIGAMVFIFFGDQLIHWYWNGLL
jgi:leader peptidase (prepilin peptidase)/N-methyltransferase